jgi:hypothetical protein
MPSCDDQEIAIEMRLHGALDADASAALDAHLSTCQRCRAFEASARNAEAIMREGAQAAMETVDWGLVDRAIVRWRWRTLALGFAVVAIVAYAAEGLMDGQQEPVETGLLILVFAALGGEVWRRARSFTRAGRNADTIELLRQDLDARGRAIDRSLLVFPLMSALFAWRSVEHGEVQTMPLSLAVIGIVTTAYVWFVKRPALARARAELGRPGSR